jgi:hypothetical protein
MQDLLSARDKRRFDMCCSALQRLEMERVEMEAIHQPSDTAVSRRMRFLNSLETECIKYEKKALLQRARWIAVNSAQDDMLEIKEAVDDFVHSNYSTRLTKKAKLDETMKTTFPDNASRALYIGGLMTLPLAEDKFGGTFVASIEGMEPLERCVGYYSLLENDRMHHIHLRGLEKAKSIALLQQSIECGTRSGSLRVCMSDEMLDQIHQHGLSKVHCGVNDAASPTFFQCICRKRSLCGRCGGSGHASERCSATQKAKWASLGCGVAALE